MFAAGVVVLLLLAGGSAAVAAVGLVGAWALRTRWRLDWQGRSLELVQGILTDELRVDGVQVASFSVSELSGVLGGARMSGRIRSAVHDELPVVAVIDGNLGRASRHAIYIGGERVAGDLDDDEARAASAPPPEPADARWPAARALLGSLDGNRDPKVREAGWRIGHGLRDALRYLATLHATAEAHAALGGDVAEAARTLEDEVERWLAALRELHLQATVKAGGADDVLSRVRAEGEVDAAIRARARELVRTRRAPET